MAPKKRQRGISLHAVIVGVLCVGIIVVVEASDDREGESSYYSNSESLSGDSDNICDNDLTTFLPPPYNNLTHVVCKPIWNTFVLRYTQNEDNVMNIIVSAVYTSGWVGMGFSKDGMMVGSSAVAGWVTSKGQAKIKQFYLQGSTRSRVVADKGELPLTGIPATVVLHGPRIYLAFQMKFDAPLARQPLIFALGFAYPRHQFLSKHDDKTTVMFDFSAGSQTGEPRDFRRMKKNHGIMAVLGWGLILPFGAIVARYLKHKEPVWYYLHSVTQLVGFVFGVAAVVLGQQLYNNIGAHFRTHRALGIFVLVLSILQVLAFFVRPNKETKIRKYWNWYHVSIGRLSLLFAAINILLGIQIGGAGNDFKVAYGFILALILLSLIVLELLRCLKRSQAAKTDPNFPINPPI